MSMETRNYVNQIRNTRTFTFEASCGGVGGNGINDDIGKFDILINPNAYPQDIKATRAIFKLISFYVGGQTDVERCSGDVNEDDSGFNIHISGLGLEASLSSTAKSCQNKGNFFQVINTQSAGGDNALSGVYSRLSGGIYEGPEILCSNPLGTLISVSVFSIDAPPPVRVLTRNDNLDSYIKFSIQLIPDEISQNY